VLYFQVVDLFPGVSASVMSENIELNIQFFIARFDHFEYYEPPLTQTTLNKCAY